MQKILIIDDEKPTLTMFHLFLSAYGYDVSIAEDGRTGLDILEKENPPIVFTDIKMPGMDGFEVLKQIKKISPRTEVIVITGHGDMDLVIRALNLGATDFINKPVQRSALDAALKRAQKRIAVPGNSECSVTFQNKSGVAVIYISGFLSSGNRSNLMATYEKACSTSHSGVVFHFDPYMSINSAGISLVAQLLGDVIKREKNGAFCGLSENFIAIFDTLGITRSMDLFETEQDAIASLSKKSQSTAG